MMSRTPKKRKCSLNIKEGSSSMALNKLKWMEKKCHYIDKKQPIGSVFDC